MSTFRPMKIYRTCTFSGLGAKKDEFLKALVKAFEDKGLREVPPVEPFELSVGIDDALRIWDRKIFDTMWQHQMIGTDALLVSDEKGAHLRIGLRTEPKGENLRCGYFHIKQIDNVSVSGAKRYLKIITMGVIAAVWGIFAAWILTGKSFWETYGLTTYAVVAFLLGFIPVIVPIVILIYYNVKKTLKEYDRTILREAKSMGGEQITPFKWTTVELES